MNITTFFSDLSAVATPRRVYFAVETASGAGEKLTELKTALETIKTKITAGINTEKELTDFATQAGTVIQKETSAALRAALDKDQPNGELEKIVHDALGAIRKLYQTTREKVKGAKSGETSKIDEWIKTYNDFAVQIGEYHLTLDENRPSLAPGIIERELMTPEFKNKAEIFWTKFQPLSKPYQATADEALWQNAFLQYLDMDSDAVAALQRAVGTVPDGVGGPHTLELMYTVWGQFDKAEQLKQKFGDHIKKWEELSNQHYLISAQPAIVEQDKAQDSYKFMEQVCTRINLNLSPALQKNAQYYYFTVVNSGHTYVFYKPITDPVSDGKFMLGVLADPKSFRPRPLGVYAENEIEEAKTAIADNIKETVTVSAETSPEFGEAEKAVINKFLRQLGLTNAQYQSTEQGRSLTISSPPLTIDYAVAYLATNPNAEYRLKEPADQLIAAIKKHLERNSSEKMEVRLMDDLSVKISKGQPAVEARPVEAPAPYPKLTALKNAQLLSVDMGGPEVAQDKKDFIKAQLQALNDLPENVLNFLVKNKVQFTLGVDKNLTNSDVAEFDPEKGISITAQRIVKIDNPQIYVLHEIGHAIINKYANLLETNIAGIDTNNSFHKTLVSEAMAEAIGCRLLKQELASDHITAIYEKYSIDTNNGPANSAVNLLITEANAKASQIINNLNV